jgi:hypothetical protein
MNPADADKRDERLSDAGRKGIGSDEILHLSPA